MSSVAGPNLTKSVGEEFTSLSRLRWVAIAVFVLSNSLNFLDRQLLAAVAPTIKTEFHLSNPQYGGLISAFAFIYATAVPFAGLFVDRVGLNIGVAAAVGVWSLAGMATGIARTFRGLLVCRGVLGLGESAMLPVLSKGNAMYLPSAEWGLASAAGSLALTAGSVVAPLLAASMSPRYGWRSVFVLAGSLGLIWIALWLVTARRIPPQTDSIARLDRQTPVQQTSSRKLLTDRRLWRVILAYPLVLVVLILWLNWTTIYLVQEHSLSQSEANRYFAWIPPIFAAAGGFFNGLLTFRWIRRGMDGLTARMRVCLVCAPMFLISAATPAMPSTAFAIGAVCVGLFACQSVVGSLNIMPLDLFGPGHAAFSISLLACSYAVMQTLISPLIGASVDRFGFSAVCIVASMLPLLGIWILRGVFNPPNSAKDART